MKSYFQEIVDYYKFTPKLIKEVYTYHYKKYKEEYYCPLECVTYAVKDLALAMTAYSILVTPENLKTYRIENEQSK